MHDRPKYSVGRPFNAGSKSHPFVLVPVCARPEETPHGTVTLGGPVAYTTAFEGSSVLADILNTDYVKITTGDAAGRILEGKVGMVFKVDSWTTRADKKRICHVIDYRYPNDSKKGFQVWTLGVDGFEEL